MEPTAARAILATPSAPIGLARGPSASRNAIRASNRASVTAASDISVPLHQAAEEVRAGPALTIAEPGK